MCCPLELLGPSCLGFSFLESHRTRVRQQPCSLGPVGCLHFPSIARAGGGNQIDIAKSWMEPCKEGGTAVSPARLGVGGGAPPANRGVGEGGVSPSVLSVHGMPSLRTRSPGLGAGCPHRKLVCLSVLVSPESLWGGLLCPVWLHRHPCPLLAAVPFCGNLLSILGVPGVGSSGVEKGVTAL